MLQLCLEKWTKDAFSSLQTHLKTCCLEVCPWALGKNKHVHFVVTPTWWTVTSLPFLSLEDLWGLVSICSSFSSSRGGLHASGTVCNIFDWHLYLTLRNKCRLQISYCSLYKPAARQGVEVWLVLPSLRRLHCCGQPWPAHALLYLFPPIPFKIV